MIKMIGELKIKLHLTPIAMDVLCDLAKRNLCWKIIDGGIEAGYATIQFETRSCRNEAMVILLSKKEAEIDPPPVQ